jgi:L-aspartate oxidase
MTKPHTSDVLIIGSGAAGLTAALNLADRFRVTVLAKGGLAEGSTAVLEPGDTFDSHIEDTMIAGAGLNDRKTVEFVVENAPRAIERLIELGVPFNKEGGDLHLTREGGHSHRRIVHVNDATGWAVQEALLHAAQAHANITLVPDMVVVDLATSKHEERYSGAGNVWGVYAVNRASGRVELFTANATILATGGAGRTYLFSTAPRGETGYRFMPDFDPRAELAPPDIVARAIDHEIKRLGLDYVHLDISHMGAEFVTHHFPTIYEKLKGLGIDMTKEPIPVVPAQHYTCGGIVIDLDGRTDLPHLYAAGECTESGLHGANRLASNSLLECFVFGEACAKHINTHWDDLPPPPPIRPWDESRVADSDEEVVIKQNWTEIRRFMWNYVGIVRTTKRLERAAHRIKLLTGEVEDYYGHFRVTPDLIELRNLLQTSDLIVRSALHRHESRGLHYTLDYPETLPVAVDTVLVP